MMRPRQLVHVVLGLWACSLGPAAARNDQAFQNERQQRQESPVKDELKRHQGTWIVTSSIYDGQRARAEIIQSIRRVVRDDHVVWERDGRSFAGTTIELDPTQVPKAIDVIPDGGSNRGEHILGIYQLEGDALTICMAAAGQLRPKEFAAEKGSGCTLRTYRRESVPAK
jgi:uncharacterized protein (TIGR03067 family)